MPSDELPSKRARAGLALGLAFLIGVFTFFITLQLLNRFRARPGEHPAPPEQRPAGAALAFPVLNADASGPSADSWTLEQQLGKVVIVNYFATWCGPCLEEIPDLAQVAAEYAPRGVVTVAISVDHDNEARPGVTRLQALRDFTQGNKLPFPILLPPENSALMKMSFPIPQTFIFDRHNRRARLIRGSIDKASLERSLDELLKEN